MDNLTHSLVGWALAETGLKQRTRKGLAACVLAANMPDIDVFFGWAPWAPLAMHRGFTHGLVGGVLLMPPLLAALLWGLDRWQISRGAIFRSGLKMRAGWLVALCYLGALTHPLLDLQNVYAVQLLSPLSDRWFHADGLFIVDLWLMLTLTLGIWSARRTGATWPARTAFSAVVAYILLNVAISHLASTEARARIVDGTASSAPPAVDRIFAAPRLGAFWRRDVLVHWTADGKGAYQSFAYDPLAGGLAPASEPLPDGLADPLARRAAKASAEVIDFLAWSQMPFARVQHERCAAQVTFGDARFAGPRMAGSFNASAQVPVKGAGCPPG